jgi:hypothetical protein
MFKAIFLLFAPQRIWESIASAQRGVAYIFLLTTLPLLVLSASVEGYGLLKRGDLRGELGRTVTVTQERMIRYETVQVTVGLILVFGGAWLIKHIATSFHFYPSYTDCFRLTAYGTAPHFLARMADGFPQVNTWLCLGAGAFGVMYGLYHGNALVLKPDITKGFGLYVLSTLVLILILVIGHLLAVATLSGRLWP